MSITKPISLFPKRDCRFEKNNSVITKKINAKKSDTWATSIYPFGGFYVLNIFYFQYIRNSAILTASMVVASVYFAANYLGVIPRFPLQSLPIGISKGFPLQSRTRHSAIFKN